MARTTWLLPASGIVWLSACQATAVRVRGPDGQADWYEVTCSDAIAACHAKAADLCPEGYVTAFSEGHPRPEVLPLAAYLGPTGGGTYSGGIFATSGYVGNVLLKCVKGGATATTGPDPIEQEAARRVQNQCLRAYEDVGTMPSSWSGWFGGAAVASPPDAAAFVHLCETVDDDAIRCLDGPYASAHRDACIDEIRKLSRDTRHAIDRLFVTRGDAASP